MSQEIKITVSGPNNSGKTTVVSLINLFFGLIAHPETDELLPVSIDPNSQTMLEGGVIVDEDDLLARVVSMFGKGISVTITDR